jgi:hypothetical protein
MVIRMGMDLETKRIGFERIEGALPLRDHEGDSGWYYQETGWMQRSIIPNSSELPQS